MKSICFHFTVSGVPTDKRLAFLTMVNAIAEYMGCEVGGGSEGKVIDFGFVAPDNGVSSARASAYRFRDALHSIDRMIYAEYGADNV